MKMFFIAGIGVAVLIEILLVSKKNKSVPDQILSIWMFVVLVHLFLLNILYTGDIYNLPFLLGLEHPLPLLQGVFLFIYVSILTDQVPRKRAILLLHFVPAAVFYMFLIPFFALPAAEKVSVYVNKGAGYETYMTLKVYAIRVSGIVYVTWSALLLREHKKKIRDQFSDLEKVNLQWLQMLTLGLAGIWFVVLVFSNEVLVIAGMVIFVFLIGFFGVRQAAIFAPAQMPPETIEEEKQKYIKSGLSEEASEKLHQALLQLMKDESLYKKPDLSITDVASKLNVHPNYLSQIINQREKKNFYDFVNGFRFEEFKRLIAANKNQQYTLLALAYDCGFSSKSSFNRFFKRATGKTPSEFSSTLAETPANP